MKLKIKVKVLDEKCAPEILVKGDWIDLRSRVTIDLPAPQWELLEKREVNGEELKLRNVTLPVYYIKLGVAIQLPKGFEAVINSRSSLPKKQHLMIPNGQGVIDNCYCGNNDEWAFICSPLDETSIKAGDRICQFRIQLSQKATVWQKLKWLFSSGVKLVFIDNLTGKDRNGFGSTGVN